MKRESEYCALQGYYSAGSGNTLPRFLDRYVVPKRRYGIITTGCVIYHNSAILIYRVSIKSFPNYKHLLQENYVEYKHIKTYKHVT